MVVDLCGFPPTTIQHVTWPSYYHLWLPSSPSKQDQFPPHCYKEILIIRVQTPRQRWQKKKKNTHVISSGPAANWELTATIRAIIRSLGNIFLMYLVNCIKSHLLEKDVFLLFSNNQFKTALQKSAMKLCCSHLGPCSKGHQLLSSPGLRYQTSC